MYCRYCGKTLTNSASCPRCGRENGPLEGGNGFWDILREPAGRKEETLAAIEVKAAPRTKAENGSRVSNGIISELKRSNQLLRKGIIIVMLICALLIGIMAAMNGRINQLEKTVDSMAYTTETVQREKESISEELAQARHILSMLEEPADGGEE